MTGSPTRVLVAGVTLCGAFLTTSALAGTGSDLPTAAQPARALVTAAVAPAAVVPAPALPRPRAATTTAITTARTSPAVPAPRASATATATNRATATPTSTATAGSKAAASRAAARTATTPASPSLCRGAGWQQRRGEAALRSLKAAADTGYRLRFLPARTGFYGLTRTGTRTVEVYVRSCSVQSTELLRHVLGHELGHAYDTSHLTATQRAAYMRARGLKAGTAWFGCSRCTDFATPAGDFAEVYSQWRRGATTNRSRIGNAPSAAQLDALAQRFFGAR